MCRDFLIHGDDQSKYLFSKESGLIKEAHLLFMAVEDIRKQDCSGIVGFIKDVEMTLLWNNLNVQQSTFKVYSEAN